MNLTNYEVCYIVYLLLILMDSRDWWFPISRMNEIEIAKNRLLVITISLLLCLLCDPLIRLLALIILVYKFYQYCKVIFCQGYIFIINDTVNGIKYDNLIYRVPYYYFHKELKRLTIELGSYEPQYIYSGTTYINDEQLLKLIDAKAYNNLQTE